MNIPESLWTSLIYTTPFSSWGSSKVATFDDPHDENGVVYMSEVQRDSGMFIDNLPLKAEKEM